MSDLFFEELGIPHPDYELGVGSGVPRLADGTDADPAGRGAARERPDWTLVYGDTNSTLAGALAAAKLGARVAHVEAGLRSFNRSMPEEHNRVLTDHCSDLLFCPSEQAADAAEARRHHAWRACRWRRDVRCGPSVCGGRAREFPMSSNGWTSRASRLPSPPCTVPTTSTTRNAWAQVLRSLDRLEMPVVFPVHPRTRARLVGSLAPYKRLRLIDPVGYLDMLALEQDAALVLTDSGGVQKEAYFFAVPCVTLRPETEWVETVAAGWNRLAWGDEETVHRGSAGSVAHLSAAAGVRRRTRQREDRGRTGSCCCTGFQFGLAGGRH